jgi:nucleotide-binding universal stress UspA family protein
MRILLAADGSKHGTANLLSACRILSPRRHEFELLTVAPKAPGDPEGKARTIQDRLNRRAQRIAEAVRAKLAIEGIDTKTMVKTGSPAKVLIRCAQDYDAVVVAATSHGDATYPGLGPVASRLAEYANTSVLLARNGAEESRQRILVPLDGSIGALDALEKLARLVDLAESEVTLMNVVESHWLLPLEDLEWLNQPVLEDDVAGGLEWHTDIEREFAEEGEALLDEARRRLPASATVSTIVKRGIPVNQILSEATTGKYDLVVLSATGEHDLKYRILGSVSSQVARNAPCSVLFVHGGD